MNLVFLVLLASGTLVSAQSFDVASVRPNKTGRGLAIVVLQPSGRVMTDNMAVRDLIVTAYGIEPAQLLNAPAWATSERFAIEAITDGNATSEQVRLMLRALLAERFQLSVHTESRTLSVLALVKARKDGRLGDRLRPSGGECRPITPPPGVPMPPPPPPGPPGGIRPILAKDPDLRRACGAMAIPGWLSGRRVTMDQLSRTLAAFARRHVIDRSGLAGEFDLDLNFTPEFDGVGPPPAGGAPLQGPPPPPVDGPGLFTALQEQLGLKLESVQAPVDVIVIDRVERPSEN
jgi:bla regulator protein blaR1